MIQHLLFLVSDITPSHGIPPQRWMEEVNVHQVPCQENALLLS